MAFTTSAWGYVAQTVSDPDSNVYSTGPWGYTSQTLADPSPAGGGYSTSPWGYISYTIRNPHKPLYIKTGPSTWKAVPVVSYNGTVWR